MLERTLSHSLASSSGLARSSRLAGSPARPASRAAHGRGMLAVRAVLDLSRPAAAANAVRQMPTSVDPEVTTRVVAVHSPTEFEDALQANAEKLVVLMCKAKCCRPCKMFARKYSKIAEHYSDAAFYDIYGDESKDTRQMMMRMGVKVTPYFALYRNGQKVHGHGGVNESNLHKAIQANLLEHEAGYGTFSVAGSESDED